MGKHNNRKKYSNDVYKSFTMITQFGINMIVPILLCTFGGIFLDKKFGTGYWVIILFFVGALAGATNVYRFSKEIFSKQSKAPDAAANRGRSVPDATRKETTSEK